MASAPTIASIQHAVAKHYSVTVAMLKEPRPTSKRGMNNWDISRPRQVAMALSVLLTNHSYPRIGHYFGGRDHATVRYANVVVAKRRREDPKLHNFMRRLTLELVHQSFSGPTGRMS